MFVPQMSEPSEEYRELLRSDFFRLRMETAEIAGAHSVMVLPIGARGAILGTVAIYRMQRAAFTLEDLELARDVLERSALSLDNARVYSRERATALELQRSMLPQSIIETPGIELAYSYVPANTASEIGGDWFDVVRQPDGRVVLIVGDVAGHDIHAASLMGQIRTVTRTLATLDLSPVEVLTRLDAMVSELGSEVSATCVYAAFDPDCRCCVVARAGHPLPALVGPEGGVEFLDLPPGLPLGVGGGVFESVGVDVRPGSVLVLYTDGLVESRHAAIDVGMGNLAKALAAAHAERFGPQLAATLITRLVPDPEDDIAVLLGRISSASA
jgi:serine phosphatase RsbU (regulator of sigma subunit)